MAAAVQTPTVQTPVVSPFEQVIAAAKSAHVGAKFHDVGQVAVADGKGGKMARLLEPLAGAAEARVELMSSGLNQALEKKGFSFSTESVQAGLSAEKSSILIVPTVQNAATSGTTSGFAIPAYSEIFQTDRDIRSGASSHDKLLMTRNQEIPSRVPVFKEPVGIILSCGPFSEIDQSRPVDFDLTDVKVVWSQRAFRQAAFELGEAFDEARKPSEDLVESMKLRKHTGAQSPSSKAMTVDDLDYRFGATDFLAGMVVDSVQREFFTDQSNVEILVESMRFEKDALIVHARFADDLPEQIRTLRITLNKDSIAEGVWI